ncbi:MAG: glycosyltransferase family 2 protein [Rikenella sp.]|nr:glycosyltransferase family 2 protein [Rikenella sp.]
MFDISIIIPIYNSATTVEESVDSVVRECAGNPYSWELLLVDDGSMDDSVGCVQDYLDKSPYKKQIRLIRQRNGGAAAARNAGLRVAQGEYIAFNDSDDRWLPGKIALQMEYMAAHPEVDLLGCGYGSDNFQKGSLIRLGETTRITIRAQVSKNYFSPPTVIFRHHVIEKAGMFNEELRYAEEGFFFNNVSYLCHAVFMQKNVAEPITDKARWGESGLSGNLLKMEQGELYNIHTAYKFKYISLGYYLFAVSFSIAKFIRRWIISRYRKLCK